MPTLLLNEIVHLSPGAIIEFEKSVDGDLDLMISNKRIGGGVAVKVGENFGLKITHINPLAETIKALGSESNAK